MNIRAAIIASLTALLVAGCGYRFRAGGEPLGIKLESVAIPMIESTSSEIGFEANFTKVLRDQFISFSRVPIVPKERAQAILTGRIYDISTEPLTFNVQQQAVQGQVATDGVTSSRRLKVKLDMKLTDRETGKVIWHEADMEEKASFDVETDPLVTRYNQQRALERIARQLAERVFLKTAERF